MIGITLIVVGKFKEQYWKDAENEYGKRLSAFAHVDIREVAGEPFTSPNDMQRVMQKEAQRILNVIPKNGIIITLDRTGKRYDSQSFSQMIQSHAQTGRQLVLIVGGALGLADEISAQASEKVSLSDLTFPHQLARIVLLEQLYRALTISVDKQYHY